MNVLHTLPNDCSTFGNMPFEVRVSHELQLASCGLEHALQSLSNTSICANFYVYMCNFSTVHRMQVISQCVSGNMVVLFKLWLGRFNMTAYIMYSSSSTKTKANECKDCADFILLLVLIMLVWCYYYECHQNLMATLLNVWCAQSLSVYIVDVQTFVDTKFRGLNFRWI